MTRVRGLLGAAALLLLGGGCNTYHYFDIKVDFGTISFEEAGGIKRCEVFVTGADTDNFVLPSTGASKVACPIDSNWPTLGTFEYSTFTDSGNLTFTLKGYNMTPPMDSFVCVSGATTLPAGAAITQMGTISLAQGSQSCITQ
jgi:hypothetical protein